MTMPGPRRAEQVRPDTEPMLDADEIQGNVVPGFLKPHLAVLAFTIADPAAARRWCRLVADHVTTLRHAMGSRERVRSLIASRTAAKLNALEAGGSFRATGEVGALLVEGGVDDTWTSVAFSHEAMGKLTDDPGVDEFADRGFVLGMTARSGALGDPAGSTDGWVVRDPDVLLVVAADREENLRRHAEDMVALAESHAVRLVYREEGHKLDEVGREHFGFQDGVSQPGVRGRYAPDGSSRRGTWWTTPTSDRRRGCTAGPASTWCGRASSCSATPARAATRSWRARPRRADRRGAATAPTWCSAGCGRMSPGSTSSWTTP